MKELIKIFSSELFTPIYLHLYFHHEYIVAIWLLTNCIKFIDLIIYRMIIIIIKLVSCLNPKRPELTDATNHVKTPSSTDL